CRAGRSSAAPGGGVRVGGEGRYRTRVVKDRGARHGWFLVVLGLGVALRVVTMLGYRPALWFPDTYTYVVTVLRPRPDLVRPAGYSMFMKLLEPLHSFAAVAAEKDRQSLAAGMLAYGVRMRGTRCWIATLAADLVLLEPFQIHLEHLLVSDTLFMFLVVAAVALGLSDRPRAVPIGLLL